MSKSAILSSSIAKKWWMSLTGLFLCLFLVGHLLGNLQLLSTGDEGRLAFNEYAYFMTHNIFIKIMSYITYFSILFHAVDGILLTIQNKKARPVKYAYNKPGASAPLPSRYMAVLGSAILIFIVIHMANFWGVMHFDEMPLHTITVSDPSGMNEQEFYVTQTPGSFYPVEAFESEGGDVSKQEMIIRNGTEFYNQQAGITLGEGYKDLHSLTLSFFGYDKSKEGYPVNEYALIAVLLYVLSMVVLGFHLWHGFASAFQTVGIHHKKHTPIIAGFGKVFSVLIPLAFALIPVFLFLNK